MARRLGDDDDAARAAHRRRAGQLAAGPRRGRAAATGEVLGARRPPRLDLAAVFWARTLRLRDALEAGDLATVDAELDQLARLSADSRRSYFRWCLLVLQSARAAFAGRLAEGERLATRRSSSTAATAATRTRSTRSQRLALALPAPAPAGRAARRAARLRGAGYPALPCGRRCARRSSTRAAPTAGAAQCRGVRPRRLRRAAAQPDWLCGLALLAEPVAALGHPGRRSRRSSPRSRRTPTATR